MRKLAVVLALGISVAAPIGAFGSELVPAWFGAGVQYADGVPHYVYLTGYAQVPAYGSSWTEGSAYAYVSNYYPPRYFEPEVGRPAGYARVRVVTRTHVRLKRHPICRCNER